MFGEIAQTGSSGAICLEDSWVAKENRDDDGYDQR
jgi:hypothetical protein